MSDSVSRGDGRDLSEWGVSASALRGAISTVRQGIAKQAAFNGSGNQGEELEQLSEIEQLVEEIIQNQ